MIEQRRGELGSAIAEMPMEVVQRLAAGQQFNCYAIADHSGEWRICLGPITDAYAIGRADGRKEAKLIEAALKYAMLSLEQVPA